MESSIDKYVTTLRTTQSSITCYGKKRELMRFYRYLAAHGIHYLQVTKENVEQYLLSLDTCNIESKKWRCSVIRGFYDFLDSLDNPASQIKFKRERREKTFTVPGKRNIEGLLENISDKRIILEQRNRLMVELAYGSGLRRCELERLNVEDVDLDSKTIYVIGKGNKARIVPVTKSALSALLVYLKTRQEYRGPLFVTEKGKRLKPVSISWIFRKKVGLRTHLFRHACATHMLQNGCSLRIIQELLGHRYLTTTEIYTKINREDLRKVVEKNHPGSYTT